MWSFASLGDLTANYCIILGPSWVVACWCSEEVRWRKTFSEGWSCQIVCEISIIITQLLRKFVHFSYRLCELLYDKKRNFAKVLSCYVRDKTRRVIKYPASMHGICFMSLWINHNVHTCSLKHSPTFTQLWTRTITLSQTGRKWQELYYRTFKYSSYYHLLSVSGSIFF